MNFHDFSLENEIAKRVKLEDLVMWSESKIETPVQAVLRKEIKSERWKPTPIRGFISSVMP